MLRLVNNRDQIEQKQKAKESATGSGRDLFLPTLINRWPVIICIGRQVHLLGATILP